jgi:hypothetical protein
MQSVESGFDTGNSFVRVANYENNRRACNRSTLGGTVGGYLGTIRTLRQLVLAQASITGPENTVGGYQVTICTLMQLVLARSGVTGLELDNQLRREESQSVVPC